MQAVSTKRQPVFLSTFVSNFIAQNPHKFSIFERSTHDRNIKRKIKKTHRNIQ